MKEVIIGSFKWVLGDGMKVRFWLDEWVGNYSLKDKFPRLFSMCKD